MIYLMILVRVSIYFNISISLRRFAALRYFTAGLLLFFLVFLRSHELFCHFLDDKNCIRRDHSREKKSAKTTGGA